MIALRGVIGGVIEIVFCQSRNSFKDNKKSPQTLNLRGFARGLRDLNPRARFQTYSLSRVWFFNVSTLRDSQKGVTKA